MRQGSNRVFLLFVLLLLLGFVAQGQQYQRPKPDANGGPPTTADLTTYDGVSRSLTVQILNLTPHDIVFEHHPGTTWSITAADEAEMQDDAQNRYTKKSFMFVPVGLPTLIPGAPAQNFVPATLPDGTPNPKYDPNYEDTTTHPYAAVFSWDDHGGFVVDNWVKWNVKGVKYTWCDSSELTPNCEYRYQDVGLGLWMYRIKPTFKLSSSFLPVLVDSLKVVFRTLALPVKAESPAAWARAFLAMEELAQDAAEFAKENSQENEGNKMWVASYVIPNPTSSCVRTNSGTGCKPSTLTPDGTGDAVYSQWTGTFAGPCTQDGSGTWHCPENAAESALVVSLHILRGEKSKQCDPLYYPKVCPLGAESVVMITVMRAEDFTVGALAGATQNLSQRDESPRNDVRRFLLQAGAGKLRGLLQKQGRPGLLALRSVIEELDPAQRLLLTEMVRTMGSGRLPTQQERQLVHTVADKLQQRLERCCSPGAGAE